MLGSGIEWIDRRPLGTFRASKYGIRILGLSAEPIAYGSRPRMLDDLLERIDKELE